MPVAGAVIGGVVGLYGASKQSKAAKHAADTQAKAAADANALQLQIFNQQRSDNEPFRQAGIGAIGSEQDLLAGKSDAYDKWRNSTGYQFGFDQGQQAVERSAAARGGLNSGATLKALTRYGQGTADQNFGQYWNMLAGMAGQGQTANAQNGQYGMNYANQAGNNLNNAAAARASGYINSANAWSNGLQGAVGAIGNWYGSRPYSSSSSSSSNFGVPAQGSGSLWNTGSSGWRW